MRLFWILFALVVVYTTPVRADWTPRSKALYEQAQKEQKFPDPKDMIVQSVPMRNGRSFFLVARPINQEPKRWIVSLPGTRGYATDELSLWAKVLNKRAIGIIEVQIWLGTGDGMMSYHAPSQIYPEISRLMSDQAILPGKSMLHGFSRGSSLIYALAALDRVKGRKFFNVFVANSGGMSVDFPESQAIDSGQYGQSPYKGTQWVTVCGAKDPKPERDGCPAMKRTTAWLKERGAKIALSIEDPEGGHGALHTNPENAEKLLDWYMKE